jgi:CRISPR/Cas system-associated exonuclease Cas4 (RecB family)
VVGYAVALERELGIKIDRAKILCFPKTGKYKIVSVDISETIREAFFACVKLYQTIEGEK